MDQQLFDRTLEAQGFAMVPDDQLCPAEFYWQEKPIPKKEGETGPTQFTKVEMIKFFLAGGDTTARVARDEDKYAYPRQYAAFKKSEDQAALGWSLAHVPWLDVAQIATYKAMNITTMEALANAPDTVIQPIMGGLKHREQAKMSLAAMSDQEAASKLAAEKEHLQQQITLQAAQIKELCDKIDEMKSASVPPQPPKLKKSGFTAAEGE